VTYGLITVVDDDESMGRMLNRGLRAAGFDVAVFASAEELLNSGHLNKSACLIVDVHLPGMTGLQLQQLLKESGSSLPIILISGQPDERTATRALQDGAIGFFKKPFNIERLLATISDHLATLPSNGG
jgi:FixJ family two-component response regulator